MAEGILTKLEWWDIRINDWFLAHDGVPLLNPRRYCERLSETGKVARATILETGEIIQILPTPEVVKLEQCPLCDEWHLEPFDGSCLI